MAFREHILEDVRARHFPHKPSRLGSCFVLPTLDEARSFRDRLQRISIIYEVEPVADPGIIHEGCYGAVEAMGIGFFDAQVGVAHQYWSGPPQQDIEILLRVPIRIVRCVDDSVLDLPGLKD